MANLIDARWVGPYGYRTADGTLLESGQTVVQITRGEANESENCEPVKKSDQAKKDGDS